MSLPTAPLDYFERRVQELFRRVALSTITIQRVIDKFSAINPFKNAGDLPLVLSVQSPQALLGFLEERTTPRYAVAFETRSTSDELRRSMVFVITITLDHVM